MGMYTEFYFRARIEDGAVADWLDTNINGEDDWFRTPFDDEHTFFQTVCWSSVFIGGGAVYQESRTPIFRRKDRGGGGPYGNEFVLSSSLKNYGDEITSFIDWITPHLDMSHGDFLGYALYEDSTDDGDKWREHPTLFFHEHAAVWNA